MSNRLASLLSAGLCVCLVFGATGCGKTPEPEKKTPDSQATDGKKPEINLSAQDVEIEVALVHNETTEEAKGVVTVAAQRKNANDDEAIAVTFDGALLPQGVKIQDTTVKPKETEATATITVPKGTKINAVKTPHSTLRSIGRTVFVTGAAGGLKTETRFTLTLKVKRMEDR
jgi:hypothetical protein